jgi:hypothetical protein
VPITSQSTFHELVARYHQHPAKFVFFVGAGLSQPMFPSWGSLLKRFVDEAKIVGLPYAETEMLQYIEKGENFLDIADACVGAMGGSRYRGLMEEVFDKDLNEGAIPLAYQELINLAPSTIITTNYDRIPDVAGGGRYRVNTNKNAAEAIRSITDGRPVVFKMHGDIVDQSSIVLTTSEYQKIIHGDPATRQLLNTVLSSKYLIFVGFSMSDPHLDDILAKINVATGGIPVSHYLLLSEESQFRVNAIAKKYGLKVIAYTPADKSHPEVVEFLRALKHETAGPDVSVSEVAAVHINNKDELLQYVDSAISTVQVGGGYSVYFMGKTLILSFSPIGQTNAEVQTELLSLLRLMSFNCEIVDEVQVLIIANTRPTPNIDETQQCILKALVKFPDAQKYARREISTSILWSLIYFFSPGSITDPFQVEHRVGYPINTGLVGE